MLRALVWDVDGTVAETERDGHRVACNLAFAEAGLPWFWDDEAYAALLRVIGGRERLLALMRERDDAPQAPAAREALALQLHRRKNDFYAERVAEGRFHARPGERRLMDECERVMLAVATATSTRNVEALFGSLFGAKWRDRFAAVVGAEDAPRNKPDAQVYSLVLQRQGLAAQDAFALEDSPNGLQSALAAGIRCGLTRSAYFADAPFDAAAWVRNDLESPEPLRLAALQGAQASAPG
jgi:HAD superfamily hydrolase (TIGR01509 family)